MKIAFKIILKNQRGFTLIEILVAIAITGIIALGASVSSAQLINQTSRDRDYTMASRSVTNAIYWISHDTLMAQNIEGWAGFPATDDLSISWEDWDNQEHTVEYSLDDGKLIRTYSDSTGESSTFIADYINPDADKTYLYSDNGVLTVTITCSIGEGNRIIDITRSKQIASRPKL